MMTMSISHDHDVICPVAGKGKDLTLSCLVQLDPSPSNHSIHELFLNREEERTREREEEGGERTERRKEAELWVQESSLQLFERPCHPLALHPLVLP